ncbi:MAG: DUF2158 domain-containing protein [Gemmatimonadaceae bacterium]|nr:DUF2158 domain-containing protein [Gemmatimonadaceae bacterium]
MSDDSDNIEVGDIVMLRSGGPDLTVNAVDATTGMLFCLWFANGALTMAMLDPRAVGKLRLAAGVADIARPQLGKVVQFKPIDVN